MNCWLLCYPQVRLTLLFFLARNKGAAIHKSKIGEAGKITATGCVFVNVDVDRVHCTINRFATQWSKCFEKPAKGIASRNPPATAAYQCPLARRNQKVGSPGRICRRLCAGSIQRLPVSHCLRQIVNDPRPRLEGSEESRQTPKTIRTASSIVASPALVAAALTSSSIPPWISLFFKILRRFRAYSRFVILSMDSAGITNSVVSVLSARLPPTFHYPATTKLIRDHRVCPACWPH